MNGRATFLAIVSAIGCASAPTPTPATGQQPAAPVTSAPAGNLYARVPAEIESFKLTERSTVTGVPTDSIFRFRDSSRTILSVVVYDVPEDVRIEGDPQKWTMREGAKFKEVLDSRVRRGQIAAYELSISDTTRFTVREHSLLESFIAAPVRYPNGVITVDMQYLYLIHGKFVKVRATIPEPIWQQSRVPSFARELARRMAFSTEPFFELRLAHGDSVEGSKRFKYGDSTFFLGKTALLSDDDLVAVVPIIEPAGGLVLEVRYRAEAGERLSALLAQHVGGELALLLGSRVRNVVVIASPVGERGKLTVATHATGSEAEHIAEYVRVRWRAP